jgi:O-Antigen ligase
VDPITNPLPQLAWSTLRIMFADVHKRPWELVTAAAATTAAFAKMFVPFYLIGSTGIFVLASTVAALLIIPGWRSLFSMADKVTDFLVVLCGFYVFIIFNFLLLSRPIVPSTHLLGILFFHGMLLVFGFVTARSLNILLAMLLGTAAVYLIAIVRYIIQFGDPEQAGHLRDIFGVGDPAVFATFHQNIGFMFGLAVLAALGLSSTRARRTLFITALPITLFLLYYISARGPIVAVLCGLLFWMSADLCIRSRKIALIGIAAITLAGVIASGLFYRYALHDKDVDAIAPDAISRTIREIQDPNPGFRLQIWSRAWHRISTEPSKLLFGRGIGVYPVDENYGPPDWLLRPTEGSKHYPHSVHLEMLYETGIFGFVLFSLLMVMPIVWVLRRSSGLPLPEKAAATIYVFTLVSSEISGAFAYTYILQFFLGLMIGIAARERTTDVSTP